MIVFDIEKFWDTLTIEHLSGGYETILKYGVTHNHYDLLYEYSQTKHYKKNILNIPDYIDEEKTKKIWNKNYIWLTEKSKQIQDNRIDLLNSFVEVVTKRWSNYLNSVGKEKLDFFYRFGDNHLKNINCKKDIKFTYDTYNDVYNGNLPEKIDYQHICGGLWSMCDANLTDDVITISKYFLNKINDNQFIEKYDRFNGNGSIDNVDRMFLSLSWPMLQCLKKVGDINEAKKNYKEIINKTNTEDIFWQCGVNRSLEAGIELYKLEPTESLKRWCYDILYKLTNLDIENDYEALNERFLISFMFYKYIMKKQLK